MEGRPRARLDRRRRASGPESSEPPLPCLEPGRGGRRRRGIRAHRGATLARRLGRRSVGTPKPCGSSAGGRPDGARSGTRLLPPAGGQVADRVGQRCGRVFSLAPCRGGTAQGLLTGKGDSPGQRTAESGRPRSAASDGGRPRSAAKRSAPRTRPPPMQVAPPTDSGRRKADGRGQSPRTADGRGRSPRSARISRGSARGGARWSRASRAGGRCGRPCRARAGTRRAGSPRGASGGSSAR